MSRNIDLIQLQPKSLFTIQGEENQSLCDLGEQFTVKEKFDHFKNERRNYLSEFQSELMKNTVEQQHERKILQQKIIKLAYNILRFLINFFGLIVYVVGTYIEREEIKDPNNIIEKLEFAIAVMFTLEFLDDLRRNRTDMAKIFSNKTLVDLLTFFPIYINNFYYSNHWTLKILKVLRTLRIIRFFNLIKYFIDVKQNKILSQTEQQQDDNRISQNNKATVQFFIIIADIISMMFMSSGLIMMFEDLYPNQTFYNNGEYVKMDFTKAIYFMIVTMSSIGYGEFYPAHFIIRIWLMITLLAYVVMLSNDLTQLSECLKNVSDYETFYEYNNHIVIVGHFNDYYLWDFVHNFFADIEQNHEQSKKTKIIIIGDQEPTKYIESILFDLELQDKVNYLKCSLLDSSIYKRANIVKAKALYAFIDPTSSTYEIDAPQLIFLFMKDLNFVAPSVDIILFYAGSLKQHMHKPQIKLNEEFLVQTLKYFIIGTMVLNKGLQVHINNLSRSKQNQIRFENELIRKYADCQNQSVFQVICPPCFVGKQLREACYRIFLLSLADGGECNLNSRSIVVLGLIQMNKFYESSAYVQIEKNDQLLLLMNANQLSWLNEQNEKSIEQKYKNMYDLIIYEEDLSQELIFMMFEKKLNEYHAIEKKGSLTYTVRKLKKQSSYLSRKNQRRSSENLLEDQILFQKESFEEKIINQFYVNLFAKSDESMELHLNNHIIIIGPSDGVHHIINCIRRYTMRHLVLFTQDIYNEEDHQKLKDQENFIYAFGSYFNVKHLESLKIEKSFRILILNQQDQVNSESQDMVILILIRAIYNIYQNADIIFELQELNSLNHCFQKPGDNYDYNLFPQVLQGNVFVSSTLYTFLSRCVFNPALINFIKMLINYDNQNENTSLLHTFQIDEEIASHFLVYGSLAFNLIQNNILPIGMLTNERNIVRQMETDDKKKDTSPKISSKPEKLRERVNLHQWEGPTVLTNPPALHILNPGDFILIYEIGDLQKSLVFKSLLNGSIVQKQKETKSLNGKIIEEESHQNQTIQCQSHKRINLKKILITSLRTMIKLIKSYENLRH